MEFECRSVLLRRSERRFADVKNKTTGRYENRSDVKIYINGKKLEAHAAGGSKILVTALPPEYENTLLKQQMIRWILTR